VGYLSLQELDEWILSKAHNGAAKKKLEEEIKRLYMKYMKVE
tara:strand:- start:252 stop:377 length:126 start_codon:yes stop_codon:yes gene_type:complete